MASGAGLRWLGRSARGARAFLLLLVWGCSLPAPGGRLPAGDCTLEFPTAPIGSPPVVPLVGITDPVDPRRAPLPSSDGEGLLFATVHPPLVGVDCRGRLHPGLVTAWELSGGAPGEVSWLLATGGGGRVGMAPPLVRALARGGVGGGGIEVVRVDSPAEDRVLLTLAARDGVAEEGPRVLGHRGLSPVPPGMGWGGGVAGLRLDAGGGETFEPGSDSRGRTLNLLTEPGDRVVARVRVVPGGDPRDLLDEGAHLVLTREAAVVAWARLQPDIQVGELPRDRVHLLVVPGGGSGWVSGGLGEGLVRDVVPLGYAPSAGWAPPAPCSPLPPPSLAPSVHRPGAPPVARVVHLAGDAVARALAERVVALAGPAGDAPLSWLRRGVPGGTLRVVGLEPGAFASAVLEGADLAYVLGEPLNPPFPCVAAMALRTRLPWLDGAALLPLVETGLVALARAGAPTLVVDGTGAVRMRFPGGGR